MPYDGNRNSGGNYGQNNRGGYNGGRNGGYNNRVIEIPKTEHLDPESDYVGMAESVIKGIAENGQLISTSKVRNFLSMVSTIYDRELRSGEQTLDHDSVSALSLMRIRLVYECGRDDSTRKFVEKTKLISYLKGIKTKEDFMAYAHYLEAIIAYHRFCGGKE